MPNSAKLLLAAGVANLALLVSGCETTPTVEQGASLPDAESVEVLDSQIKEEPVDVAPDVEALCACDEVVVPSAPELTDLDRAFDALISGEFDIARAHFESHSLTAGETAESEARLGLIIVEALVNLTSARDSVDDSSLDARIELLNVFVETIDKLRREVSNLSQEKAELAEELAKREAVLKRLRELTLEQLED